jgi:hypothetical protein
MTSSVFPDEDVRSWGTELFEGRSEYRGILGGHYLITLLGPFTVINT